LSFITVATTILKDSLLLFGQLALIITAVMIMVEFFQEYRILDKLLALTSPFTRLLGISGEANLPLMAGLLLGIGYGGAIIEDTLIWVALGAMVIPIQIGRFILALGVCYLVSRFLSCFKK